MRPTAALVLASWILLLLAEPARAQLTTLETQDLRLIYVNPTQSYLAPHVARCFENSLRFQRSLFNYTPRQKVTVLLNDFADFGNAGVSVVPRNSMMMQIAPVSFVYEYLPANEPVNWTMNHEMVHVVAFDQTAARDRLFRSLFGGKVAPTSAHPETILYNYLTTPRQAAPRWYHEGIAAFIETWMAGGRGRAQGAWDEMVLRSLVRDKSRFYDRLGLVSEGTKVDFQLEVNAYLYGTRFMSYLAYRYSPETLIRWISRTDGSRSYYASQFRPVFGLSLEQAWRDWVAFEHEFQQANLEGIRQHPTTAYKDLSPHALGAVSRAYLDRSGQKLYAGFNRPGALAHLGAISLKDGAIERIIDIKDPLSFGVTSVAYDAERNAIFYTTDNHEYRDVRTVDPTTGKSRTLLKDARVGELAFNPVDRSLWGVRHLNGIATLVRIPQPYTEWKQVRSWPYGEVIYGLDVSPDGALLSASVADISGNHTLRVMKIESLLAGDATPMATTDFGTAIPQDFVFSPDGKYLYGSSYYTGVSNIFRYELATGALEALSNTETGFFRPVPLGPDSLVVFRYTGEGFVPAVIEPKPISDASAIKFFGQEVIEKWPVLKDWMVGSPAKIPLESLITSTRRYSSIKRMGFESIYPIVEGYKDFPAYGVRMNFSDPILLNRAGITASYTPDADLPRNERYHLRGDFERYDWKLRFQLNGADFYDLFGPTKTGLKGHALGLGYHKSLVYDRPRQLDLNLDTTYYGGLERLPDFQNVTTSFDSVLATRARLSYSNQRHSLGHVDEEKGLKWDTVVADDRVAGKSFPKIYSSLDLGAALPLKHSSVWLRNSAGYSTGDREEPFANFYFGGFGNNWVDHRGEKRYREWYSFPGVELNEIAGTNYARSMLEWNLPPVRFRRAGSPGFYLTWARPALFASGIVTNLDDRAVRRTVSNVGSQIDFRFSLLARLDLTLSVGHALAFEDGKRRRHETVVSLKLLQ